MATNFIYNFIMANTSTGHSSDVYHSSYIYSSKMPLLNICHSPVAAFPIAGTTFLSNENGWSWPLNQWLETRSVVRGSMSRGHCTTSSIVAALVVSISWPMRWDQGGSQSVIGNWLLRRLQPPHPSIGWSAPHFLESIGYTNISAGICSICSNNSIISTISSGIGTGWYHRPRRPAPTLLGKITDTHQHNHNIQYAISAI